jgi:hypothetical protein
MPNQLQPTSQFILYQDDNGITNINVRFDNSTDKILCHYQHYYIDY